ncbi:iron chaperone [Streptomyces sp. NPDC059070]|uniref:iron chaperone n=1 Tax=Streptomyces sp. NPDC059070 TaxID=3346713 RepID=UPI003686F2C1
MDVDVQAYIDGIAPEHRALFDRVHRLIVTVFPQVHPVLSYGMPTYRVGDRKLHVGVWRHGISLYGWDKDRAAGFIARHPGLASGKGTIRLRSQDAAELSDEELGGLVRASLAA